MNDPIQSSILYTETSILEHFAKIVNGFPLSTIFAKGSVIHIGKGPKYESFAVGSQPLILYFIQVQLRPALELAFSSFQRNVAFLI